MKIVDVNLSIGKRDESGTLIDAEYIENFMKNFYGQQSVVGLLDLLWKSYRKL